MTDAVFPSNSLTCLQTPFQFPKKLKQEDLPEYKTSTISLQTPVSGPGRLVQRSAKDGQTIDESPQVTLTFERQQFQLSETVLHFPGMHKLPGQEKSFAGEIHMYFRNTKPNRKTIGQFDSHCLIVPIKIGNSGNGLDYFQYLNREVSLRNQYLPPIGSIFTNKTSLLMYKGKDLRLRGCGLPNQEALCAPSAPAVHFLIAQTPAVCRAGDYDRLRKVNSTIEMEPPSDPISLEDLRRFCALYKNPGLFVSTAKDSLKPSPSNGTAKLDQLKCKPIDPKKDIKGDLIIVDRNARDINLKDEIAQEGDNGGGEFPNIPSEKFIQPGDIEDAGSILIGLALAVAVSGMTLFTLKQIIQR